MTKHKSLLQLLSSILPFGSNNDTFKIPEDGGLIKDLDGNSYIVNTGSNNSYMLHKVPDLLE